jgi:nucleotide-binding universal stress UspA family protein
MKAVKEAIRIAKCEGAELVLLHVMALPGAVYSPEMGGPLDKVEDRYTKKGTSYLDAASAVASSAGISTKKVLEQHIDSPVEGITRYADTCGADLIVLGSRGLSGLRGLLVGSVTNGVVQRAHCPVLVVR